MHSLKWSEKENFWVCEACGIQVTVGVVMSPDMVAVSTPLYGEDAAAYKARINRQYNKAIYKVIPYEEYLKWYKWDGKELIDRPVHLDVGWLCRGF